MVFNHEQIKWELGHLKVVAGQLRDLLDHYLQQSESFHSHAIVEEIERLAIDLRQCWIRVQKHQDTLWSRSESLPGAGAIPGNERSTDSFISGEVWSIPMIFAMQPYEVLVEQLLTDARHVVEKIEDFPDCFSY